MLANCQQKSRATNLVRRFLRKCLLRYRPITGNFVHFRPQISEQCRVPLLQFPVDEENSIQSVSRIDSQNVSPNLLIEHIIISLAHRPVLPDARRRVNIDGMYCAQSAALNNLFRFEDGGLSPALQSHNRLHPLLLCKGNKLARLICTAAQRPFHVRILASVHGYFSKAIVRVHSRRHDNEINVFIYCELLRRRICPGGFRQVVGFDCSFSGFEARIAEREDLIVGRSSQSGSGKSIHSSRGRMLPLTSANVLLWPTPLYSQTGR
jgi:hypothetical protein